MAFVVPRGNGSWEIRESHLTIKGPRSRTLGTFRTLSAEAIERAQMRAAKPLDTEALRRAAHRAGAPVALSEADMSAAGLLRALAEGARPRPALERALREALAGQAHTATSNAHAAAAWIGATPQRRGEALRDLLRLADSLPRRRRGERESFPRIESSST
jgi:hypothetical protein